MAFIDTISTGVIATGWLAATAWSARAAYRQSGWQRVVHGVNVALMVLGAVAIWRGLTGFGLLAGLGLTLGSLLVARGDRSDPFRWLLMVQFVFALFLASGAPFRGAP